MDFRLRGFSVEREGLSMKGHPFPLHVSDIALSIFHKNSILVLLFVVIVLLILVFNYSLAPGTVRKYQGRK